MIRDDMGLDLARNIILDRKKLGMTKCDVVQHIFAWEVTWPFIEPVFQEFWEAYPEAFDIYTRKESTGDVSPEDEEREEELMVEWGLDAKGEVALSLFTSMINWETGAVRIPSC